MMCLHASVSTPIEAMADQRVAVSKETLRRMFGQAPSNGATVSQPWKLGVPPSWPHTSYSFNGATVSQPWKLVVRRCCRRSSGLPSMEPRFLNRGNRLLMKRGWRTMSNLQWSHGFSTVETGDMPEMWPRPQRPSMEPRFLNRGNQ